MTLVPARGRSTADGLTTGVPALDPPTAGCSAGNGACRQGSRRIETGGGLRKSSDAPPAGRGGTMTGAPAPASRSEIDIDTVPVGRPGRTWRRRRASEPPPVARPTFSVVIAAYQAAGTVGDALRSVLAQTRPRARGRRLRRRLHRRDRRRCSPASTTGSGSSASPTVARRAAKNTAVRAARGDYVVVLDADDVFLPRRLEALAWLAAQRPDLDVLTTDAVRRGRRAHGAPRLPPRLDLPGRRPAHRHPRPQLRLRAGRGTPGALAGAIGGFDEGAGPTRPTGSSGSAWCCPAPGRAGRPSRSPATG